MKLFGLLSRLESGVVGIFELFFGLALLRVMTVRETIAGLFAGVVVVLAIEFAGAELSTVFEAELVAFEVNDAVWRAPEQFLALLLFVAGRVVNGATDWQARHVLLAFVLALAVSRASSSVVAAAGLAVDLL